MSVWPKTVPFMDGEFVRVDAVYAEEYPSLEVVPAGLARELYEALKIMSEPTEKPEPPEAIWRKRDQIALPALARYEREVDVRSEYAVSEGPTP